MFFNCSSLTTIPQLDTSKVTNMNNMLNGCSSLTTFPQLDTSKVTNISYMLYGCKSLTTLGGFTNLGQAYSTTQSANYGDYTLTLSSSTKITHDSLMNVINNLYDIAAKGVKTQQLVIGSTNLAKLTAEEIQIATDKGFSVS
jgi:surface protein